MIWGMVEPMFVSLLKTISILTVAGDDFGRLEVVRRALIPESGHSVTRCKKP